MISDRETMKLYRHPGDLRVIQKLRYGPDYGHGFLGLFKALFEGRLEEVIKDPGPPFIDEKDVHKYVGTLVGMCEDAGIDIPNAGKDLRKASMEYSTDSLFE